jgi:hypothetical protein
VQAHRPEQDLVAFAERVLALLDQGSFVATYKYAVLLALMDLCLEGTNRHGRAPDCVTTRQLAGKVIELYWPQTSEFRGRTLRQNSGRQARILTDIAGFRASLADPSAPLDRARSEAPRGFQRLVDKVEWTLILMPLPRLQVVGGETERLLYQVGWGLEIERSRGIVAAYQRTGTGFDNRILLYPGVGDHLVMLNSLLRPLVHRAWSAMVAQLNGLDESRLESFLFGTDRIALAAVRPGLLDLQDGRCFYCGGALSRSSDVDHFIPWARYPDNGIENLVLADAACNGAKRDFLAAGEHVRRWRERNLARSQVLVGIADAVRWETHPEETLGVARGLYLRLAPSARLWLRGPEFCPPDPDGLRETLA